MILFDEFAHWALSRGLSGLHATMHRSEDDTTERQEALQLLRSQAPNLACAAAAPHAAGKAAFSLFGRSCAIGASARTSSAGRPVSIPSRGPSLDATGPLQPPSGPILRASQLRHDKSSQPGVCSGRRPSLRPNVALGSSSSRALGFSTGLEDKPAVPRSGEHGSGSRPSSSESCRRQGSCSRPNSSKPCRSRVRLQEPQHLQHEPQQRHVAHTGPKAKEILEQLDLKSLSVAC